VKELRGEDARNATRAAVKERGRRRHRRRVHPAQAGRRPGPATSPAFVEAQHVVPADGLFNFNFD